MTPAIAPADTPPTQGKQRPRLLVVEADRRGGDSVRRACASGLACVSGLACEVVLAKTLAEARKILASQTVELLVADVKLPDGRGAELIGEVRRGNPHAGVVLTGRTVKLEDALEALRGGADDVVAKPCPPEQLAERISRVMGMQQRRAREGRRVQRLRQAVRRLSDARRTVARKVDLLCNDLVGAYGELSRQVDLLRTGEDFRKLCESAKDLEQLLCHTMDWIMRRCGYANIAMFLATEDAAEAESGSAFQLGAYVKYTLASAPELVEAMKQGLVRRAGREGFVRMSAEEAERSLTAAELRHLRGQAVVAANCTYLGESLATIVMFRGGDCPFTNEDAELFRAIAPILAVALAGQVRGTSEPDRDSAPDAPPNKDDRADADWWKRGEAPPF